MADQDWNGLPYGHFGNATYQTNERTWQFEKVPDLPRTLRPIGDPEIAVPSSRFSLSADKIDRSTEQPGIRYEREKTDLVKLVPTLQPAATSLQPLLHASEAIESASDRHDPLQGTLLSFGRIFDASIRRSTQVAAFVSGPTGSDLRVVQVQLQKQGWDDSRDVWLEVPVISGEEAIWKSGGAPIQQVQFAQPLESGENLLAVRTTSRVLIFKPVLRKAGPNRLHLKPLFEVSTTDNGGVPYADVAFNPWFPRQFAIADQAARWRVWEFRSRESSDASCVHTSATDEETTTESDLNDGWTRLTWICSPSVVLVATRRTVTLHDITATPSKLQDVDVGISGNSGWVLDVLSIPSSPTRTLVLTTTHVHVISVEDRNGEVRARSIMRIRHFKSSEDITLRLALFRDEEGMLSACYCRAMLANIYLDLTVILRSAMSSTLLSYRLILDDAQRTALHDPVQFKLLPHGSGNLNFGNIIGLHFQSIELAEKRSTNVEDTLLGRLREDGCRFVTLAAFGKDLAVSTVLLVNHQPEQRIPTLNSPTWKGKLLGTSSKIKDDFVIDDEGITAELAKPTPAPIARYVKERRQRAARLFGQEWTLHYEKTASKVEKRAVQVHHVDDVLMQTQEMLEQTPEHGFQPMRSLLEVSAGEVTMSDLDRASAQIARLTAIAPLPNSQFPGETDDEENNTRVVLRSLGEIPLPGLPSIDDAADSVTPVYDAIVSHWITPLHSKVPGRIRLAKEQLARRLAAELTLARHVFCIEDTEEQPESQQDAKPVQDSQSWDLPMHPASSQLYNPYTSQLQSQSQSVLPTPSPTGTPSVTTASSRATTFSSAEVSNLMKFTTFTKPTPSALPRNLTKLLAHWTPGADPEAYDWITTSRSISQRTREEEADSQLTEKQRARAHRKAERYIRRQRKEAEASQMQMMASSQMPELVVSASQPLPPPSARKPAAGAATFSQPQGRSGMAPPAFGGVLNSSQHMGPGAASQAVPGRFGGRPPVKKKRKQGF
jgi:RNA polymerase I-specific transcription initiation factor RRN6